MEDARRGRPRKLSSDDMKWVYNAITQRNLQNYCFEFYLWSLNIILEMVEIERGKNLSKSAVNRLLVYLGYSPRCPIYKSYKHVSEKINSYITETFPESVSQAKMTSAAIFFVDDASVRSDALRGLSWGKIGKTPVVRHSGRCFNLNVISAVSPRGDMRFSFIEDKIDSKQFFESLKELHKYVGQPILVITDNARYHQSNDTQLFIERQGGAIKVVFLTTYSPVLNSGEQAWNTAKALLSKLTSFTKEYMEAGLLSILRSIQKQTVLIKRFIRMKETLYICDIIA